MLRLVLLFLALPAFAQEPLSQQAAQKLAQGTFREYLELLSAEFDLRTTPEAPPEYLFSLVKKHIEGLGYHLVDGPPTDQDRAAYDKLATLTMGSAGRAVRTPLESPLGKWVYDSLVKTSGDPKVVRIRMMGGSVPTDSLVEGIRTIAGMLRSPYR